VEGRGAAGRARPGAIPGRRAGRIQRQGEASKGGFQELKSGIARVRHEVRQAFTASKGVARRFGVPLDETEFSQVLPVRGGADSFEKGSYMMTHVKSIEPKRWQKFALRLLSCLGDAPGGNPNRCPVTGARYSLPVEVRQAFTKVESPDLEVARVLEEIKRRFGVAVEQVQSPEDPQREGAGGVGGVKAGHL
jgi:hypothetical protein